MSESRGGENQNSHNDFNHTDDATSIIFVLPTPFSAHRVSVFVQGAGSFPDFFLWKENMFQLFRL